MAIIIAILLLVGLFFILRGLYFFLKGMGLFVWMNSMFVNGIFNRRRCARIRKKIDGLNLLHESGLIMKGKYDTELAKLMDQYTT